MDQSKDSCGSKVGRPRPPKPELIMDTFAYGRSAIPVAWGNSSVGPAPPTGRSFKTVWNVWSGPPKPIQHPGPYSVIDGRPSPKFFYNKTTREIAGPSRIIDGNTGKPVHLDPADIESDNKFFESIRTREVELGFDLRRPPTFLPTEIPYGITFVTEHDRNLIVFQLREDLKYHEERFKRQYTYGTIAYESSDPFAGSMEVKHCLTARSHDAFCWMDKSSGIKWVGVYGINAICVVTLSGHVDWKRVHGGLATTDSETILSVFRKCVLSELEDLADPSSNVARRRFDVPFCVASATPETIGTPNGSGVETSRVDYAAKAIDFVRSSGLLPMVFDSGDAIRLAISAFERLIQKKFVAEEIEVTVVSGRSHGIPTYKDLGISEMNDILAVINTTSETVV